MRVAGISLAYSSIQDVQKVVRAGWFLGCPLPPLVFSFLGSVTVGLSLHAFALVCPALGPADTRLLPGLQRSHPTGPGCAPSFAGRVIQRALPRTTPGPHGRAGE